MDLTDEKNQKTALSYARDRGHGEIVDLLVANGAN